MSLDVRDFDAEFVNSRLFVAIKEKNHRHVLTYIKKGDNVNNRCKKSGMTYLHVVIKCANPISETKYVPIIYLFSNADIELNVADNSGTSPLQLAIKHNLLEIMEALIKCGTEYIVDPEDTLFSGLRGPCVYELINKYKFFSPGYWNAVKEDKAFRVNVLVKSWCRINVSQNGITLIEFAKKSFACDKIVKQLTNNEASIEFAHATMAGDKFRMKYLLDHYKIDMDITDCSHRDSYFEPYSPLSLYGAALKYGHKDILELLRTDNNSQANTVQSTVCSVS